MFTHHGKSRTLSHNLKIASLLSFVAGVVNVAGFLAVQKLTTNVTGHFAFFVDEVFKLHFAASMAYFLYIFFFFLGSFTSSFLIEIISRKNMRYVFVIPTIIECIIISCCLIRQNVNYRKPEFNCLQFIICHGVTKFISHKNFWRTYSHYPLNWLIYRSRH